MENITQDEIRQMDVDRLKYVDILDRYPQLGCVYAMQICGKDLGCCLCVKDRPSNQPMFVSANGDAPIGGIKEGTMLCWDKYKTVKYPVCIPDSYELDEDWIFHGFLFKIDLERAKPYDVMLKLLK